MAAQMAWVSRFENWLNIWEENGLPRREKQMFTKETVGGTFNIIFLLADVSLLRNSLPVASCSDLASSLHKKQGFC